LPCNISQSLLSGDFHVRRGSGDDSDSLMAW
jgi:hypothetical protein